MLKEDDGFLSTDVHVATITHEDTQQFALSK
jgi:hypothetical protein